VVVAARVLAGEVEPEVLVEPLVLVEDDVLVLVLPEVLPTVTVEVEVDTVGVKDGGGAGVGASSFPKKSSLKEEQPSVEHITSSHMPL